LEELEQAARNFLAWKSILADAEGDRPSLNLDNFQRATAVAQKKTADQTVQSRIAEAFNILLVPAQENPKAGVSWNALRVAGSDGLAVRAWKKLKSDELLVPALGATILRKHLDDVLWRGDHVAVKQLVDDFARYLYLPRLAGPEVLTQAVRDGVGLLTWVSDSFAYAESFDEKAKRYRGLRAGQMIAVSADSSGLLVKSEVAREQMSTETPPTQPGQPPTQPGGEKPPQPQPPTPPSPAKPKRFHGTVELDPARVGRDASRIAEEVIAHLAGQVGAEVRVTLEIEASLPAGATDQVVRTVTENCRTLKFDSHGFERE
jgi:hypothetical protein